MLNYGGIATPTLTNIERVASRIFHEGDAPDDRFHNPQDINFIERWEIQKGRELAEKWLACEFIEAYHLVSERDIEWARTCVQGFTDDASAWDMWGEFAERMKADK